MEYRNSHEGGGGGGGGGGGFADVSRSMASSRSLIRSTAAWAAIRSPGVAPRAARAWALASLSRRTAISASVAMAHAFPTGGWTLLSRTKPTR